MDITAINEIIMAAGALIPSAVLWQVWNIRSTFIVMDATIARMEADIIQLKRHQEDADLIKQVTK